LQKSVIWASSSIAAVASSLDCDAVFAVLFDSVEIVGIRARTALERVLTRPVYSGVLTVSVCTIDARAATPGVLFCICRRVVAICESAPARAVVVALREIVPRCAPVAPVRAWRAAFVVVRDVTEPRATVARVVALLLGIARAALRPVDTTVPRGFVLDG